MTKHTFDAKLVKLGESGVGVAQINAAPGREAKFVYFRPRDLPDYRGETWKELAHKGLTPGRALSIDVDLDAAGAVHQVSSVRISES